MTSRLVDGRRLELSNLDKVLFPDDGITKGDLIAYYEAVAGVLLPNVRGRAVALKRFPDGIGVDGFFQKSRPADAPDWVGRVEVPLRQGGAKTHVTIDDAATLVYLANLGTVELHRWLSCARDLEHADEVVFDLDPAEGTDAADVRWAARVVRGLLEDELGAPTRLKTSGSKGFHVHVPLAGRCAFDAVRTFADDAADLLAARHPDRLTTASRRAERGGRIYLDVGRNAYGQTIVTAYSVRARPGAPVATPIDWGELSGVHPRRYSLRNVRRRLGQKADPWSATPRPSTSLEHIQRTLDEVRAEDGR